MQLSSQAELAIRCVIDISKIAGPEGKAVSAAEVADIEGISLPYAQKILRQLADSKLVDSKRGAGGGYTLARPVETISVGEVLRSVDGLQDVHKICKARDCTHVGNCSIEPLWQHINLYIIHVLDSVSISVLIAGAGAVQQHLQRHAPIPPKFICPVDIPESPITLHLEKPHHNNLSTN